MENCPKCGNPRNPDENVCPECGTETGAGASSAACPPPVPEPGASCPPPFTGKPLHRPENGGSGVIVGVIITVIVLALAGIGIGIYALIRTINKTHEKIELIEESFEPDFDEISVSAQPVPNEETAIAEETITETYANTYPDYHFGSEWESKKQSVATLPGARPFSAEGYISRHNVEVVGYWLPNNQLAGRYYNENGIQLDFNGYISESTGDLKVKLGHGSEESEWRLSRDGEEGHYQGTWGKHAKSSELWLVIE